MSAGIAAIVVAATAYTLNGDWTTTALASTAGPAATTAGCGRNPTLTNGTHTIQSSGRNRTYILSIPSNYNNTHPYRLMFGLHWLNGTANDVATGGSDGAVWAFYGQKQLSDNSTIFVAPQGINNGWANTNGQDLTLIDNLVQLIEGDLCVDTSELFALGWSYGGAMSYAIACARPDVFRAVTVYSGADLSGCEGGTQPIGYFGIHGTHDSVLNISFGRSLRDTFVRNNGCTPQNPPEPARGSLTHILTTYSGCRAGYPVQWAAFDGDHTPDPVDGSTGTSGARTWTSAAVFQFFAQFQSTTTPPSSPPPSSAPPSSAPPSSAPPSSPPPSTPPTSGQPGTCTATYSTVNSWPGGFQGEITVTNNTATTVNGWTVHMTLAGGQTITNLWNGNLTGNTGTVTVTNAPYNATINAGTSTAFGFIANGTNSPTPTNLTCTSA